MRLPVPFVHSDAIVALVPQFDEEVKVMEDLAALSMPVLPPKPSALRFLTGSQPMMRIQNVLQLEPDDIAIQLTIREFDILKVAISCGVLHLT